MELTVGLAFICYYTWWILLLVTLEIIIFKLVMQQNFQVAFRIGITNNGNQGQPEQMLFEPLLIRCRNRQTAVADSNTDDQVQQ